MNKPTYGNKTAAETILVLGSSNMDLVVRIPRFHNPGETIAGGNVITVFGGKGANQAIASMRLGGRTTFLTKLGNDPQSGEVGPSSRPWEAGVG